MCPLISARNPYEPDRIWSALRREYMLRPEDFPTAESLQTRLDEIKRYDKYLGNLGKTGWSQVIEMAGIDYGKVRPEQKLSTIMAMRERGLLTASEYQMFATEMGYTANEAEYIYRDWTGTERAVWTMKYKGLLRHGEYSKLYRAKGLTRGAAYYRYRRYLHAEGYRPFIRSKPVERKKSVMP